MRLLGLLAAGAASGALVVAGAVVFGEGSSANGTPAPSAATLVITITGMHTDQATPSNFAVRPGQLVNITIVNRSPLAHTFTIPAIGLNEPILAATGGVATTATFTFTAGQRQLEWFCIPCRGHMHGEIYAILGHPMMHGVHWQQAA